LLLGRLLDKLENGNLLIENLNDRREIKVERIQAAIEPELVYSLYCGGATSRVEKPEPYHTSFLPSKHKPAGIPEAEMSASIPEDIDYFEEF